MPRDRRRSMDTIGRIVSSPDAASEGTGLCAWAPASIPHGRGSAPVPRAWWVLRAFLTAPTLPHRSRGSAPPFRADQGGELHGLEGAPRALPSNHLRLVHADHRFGEGIVIGIALAADRRRDAGVHEAIRVPHREILRPGITVMYEAGEGVAPAGVDRLLQRIQHTVPCAWRPTPASPQCVAQTRR